MPNNCKSWCEEKETTNCVTHRKGNYQMCHVVSSRIETISVYNPGSSSIYLSGNAEYSGSQRVSNSQALQPQPVHGLKTTQDSSGMSTQNSCRMTKLVAHCKLSSAQTFHSQVHAKVFNLDTDTVYHYTIRMI